VWRKTMVGSKDSFAGITLQQDYLHEGPDQKKIVSVACSN